MRAVGTVLLALIATSAAAETITAARYISPTGRYAHGILGDALEWEPSRGGALFPHLYRPLKIEDVVWAQPLPLVDGAHEFPAGLGAASA